MSDTLSSEASFEMAPAGLCTGQGNQVGGQ